MKFKIIDKCCNEYIQMELKISNRELFYISYKNKPIEIAPAKKGHLIIVHPDLTIEYIPKEIK